MAENPDISDVNSSVSNSNEIVTSDIIEEEVILASSEITQSQLSDSTSSNTRPNSVGSDSNHSVTTSEGFLCPLTGLISYSTSDTTNLDTLADVSITSSSIENVSSNSSDSIKLPEDTEITQSADNGASSDLPKTNSDSVTTSNKLEEAKSVNDQQVGLLANLPIGTQGATIPNSSPNGKFDEKHGDESSQQLPPISTLRPNVNFGEPLYFPSVSYVTESVNSLNSVPEFYSSQNSNSSSSQNSYYNDLLGYVPDFTDLYHQSLTSLWQPCADSESTGVVHPSLQQSTSSSLDSNYPHNCPSQPLGTATSDFDQRSQTYPAPPKYAANFPPSCSSAMPWTQTLETSCFPIDATAQAQAAYGYQFPQADSSNIQAYYQAQLSPKDYSKFKTEQHPTNFQLPANDYLFHYHTNKASNQLSIQTRSLDPNTRGYVPHAGQQSLSFNQSVHSIEQSRGQANQISQQYSSQSANNNQGTIKQSAANNNWSYSIQPTQSENINQSETSFQTSSTHCQQSQNVMKFEQKIQDQKQYTKIVKVPQGTSVLKQLLASPCKTVTHPNPQSAANLKRETASQSADGQQHRRDHQKIDQPVVSTQKPNIVVLRQTSDNLSTKPTVSSQLRNFANVESQQNAVYNAARANMNMLEKIEQLRRQRTARELMEYQRYRANYVQQQSQVQGGSAVRSQPLPRVQTQPTEARGLPPPYCVKWSILNNRARGPTATSLVVPRSVGPGKSQPTPVLVNRPSIPGQVTVINAQPPGTQKTMLSAIVQHLPPFKDGKVDAKVHRPRHYDMIRLEIGNFKVLAPPDTGRKLINRIKVLFTKRRFVYEFELNLPRALVSGGDGFITALFCIHVPFITIDVISCHENIVRLLVNRQPEMYFGMKSQSSGTKSIYDTTQRVDITSGEIASHPLHKILLKNNQADKLKSFLCQFDERFARMFSIPIMEPIPSRPLPPATAEELESFHTLPPVIITRATSAQMTETQQRGMHIRVTKPTEGVQPPPQSQLKRPLATSHYPGIPIPAKEAKLSEPKKSITVITSPRIIASPDTVQQSRKKRETQIAGIVKLPEIDGASAGMFLEPSKSPIDLSKTTSVDEPQGCCSCRTSCKSLRCDCAKDTKICNPTCSCNNCDNPLNILQAHSVDVNEALRDSCLYSNIFKIMNLDDYLNRTVKLGCCQETVRYLDCIPGSKNCPKCNAEIKYSWCRGIIFMESTHPRRHCEICNKCAYPDHQLYCLCHKPKKSGETSTENATDILAEENKQA